ncbi:hypothetical protein ABEB36_015518 [Hypothenemus hampei]|uniref:GIY-YIG homing endonuclease n=1 Tax=Hypothenemus hampei TaxID=57062 RepID=A0ABD1DZN0_HYPHA
MYCSLPFLGNTSYKIAKLLSKKNISISFKSPKTQYNIFCSNKDKITNLKHSGAYSLTAPTDYRYSIGRTFRCFDTRLKEHINEVNNANKNKEKGKKINIDNIKSHYAKHILLEDLEINETKFDILFKKSDNNITTIVEKYYIMANNNKYILNNLTKFPEIKLYNNKIKELLKTD